MRILLTGITGQVGWELHRSLQTLGEVIGLDRRQADLAQPETLRAVVRELRPGIIVNAAGYTQVDRAEDEEALATTINGQAPGVLAEEAARGGALLVHYSTDYVFDGIKGSPYTEADTPNPLNAYGRSKLAGEQAVQAAGGRHLILRASWVYSLRGRNFLRAILAKARAGEPLRVVNDQTGSPTWSRHLAEATAQLLALHLHRHPGAPEGLLHVCADGATSWHGFARHLLRAAAVNASVAPVATADYPVRARRPADSRLDCGRLRAAGLGLADWREAVGQCLADAAVSPVQPPVDLSG